MENENVIENVEILLEFAKHNRVDGPLIFYNSKLMHDKEFVFRLAEVNVDSAISILAEGGSLINDLKFMLEFIKIYPSQIENLLCWTPLELISNIKFMLSAASLNCIAYEFFDFLVEFLDLKHLLKNGKFHEGYKNYLSENQESNALKERVKRSLSLSKKFSEKNFIFAVIKQDPSMFSRMIRHIISKWGLDAKLLLNLIKNHRILDREKIFTGEGAALAQNAAFMLEYARRKSDCVDQILNFRKSNLLSDKEFIVDLTKLGVGNAIALNVIEAGPLKEDQEFINQLKGMRCFAHEILPNQLGD